MHFTTISEIFHTFISYEGFAMHAYANLAWATCGYRQGQGQSSITTTSSSNDPTRIPDFCHITSCNQFSDSLLKS